jgi:hypothetical protein
MPVTKEPPAAEPTDDSTLESHCSAMIHAHYAGAVTEERVP